MTGEMPEPDTYALRSADLPEVAAPDLAYRPPMPVAYAPRIGLIGAGGIAASHLEAYRTAGWTVAAICNRTLPKARARAAEFYPQARVTDRVADILDDPDIDVVDITPHPADRIPIIEAALRAGKHVLSQKPFVLDLEVGRRLCDLADARRVKLAVNQNGRWAPHMAWMRAAVQAGLIGEVIGVHASLHWDHGWIAGTEFERIEDLILSDFGIHWFDFVASVTPGRARSVFASSTMARGQSAKVPLMAQVLIALEGGQASLVFDGGVAHGPRDSTYIAGTRGSLRSDGPDLGRQAVTLTTKDGVARPELVGTWFNDGFQGAMGALLVAIETGGEPQNGARENLASLALAFAAIAARRAGARVPVGRAVRLEA